MAYDLAQFTDDLIAILKAKGVDGIGDVAVKLRGLLINPGFAAVAFPDETMHKRILFHDPETGVYVQAQLQEAGKRGKPHSHAGSWAVYGNLRGVTHMTEWRRVNARGKTTRFWSRFRSIASVPASRAPIRRIGFIRPSTPRKPGSSGSPAPIWMRFPATASTRRKTA